MGASNEDATSQL
jgi:hypothetical protein